MANTNVLVAALRDRLLEWAPVALPGTPKGAALMTPAKLRYYLALSAQYEALLRLAEDAIEREREESGDAGAEKLRASIFGPGRVPEDSGVDPSPEPGDTREVDGGTGLELYRYNRS